MGSGLGVIACHGMAVLQVQLKVVECAHTMLVTGCPGIVSTLEAIRAEVLVAADGVRCFEDGTVVFGFPKAPTNCLPKNDCFFQN